MAPVIRPSFQIAAYPSCELQQPLQLAREVLDASPAMTTDIKRLSDKLIVFQLNVRLAQWDAFVEALAASELGVEAALARPTAAQADADGDVFGTLSITLRGGGDKRDLIPSVPG